MARGFWCAALVTLFWACGSEDSHPSAGAGGNGDAGQATTGGGQESSAGSGTEPDAGASSSLGGVSAQAGMSSVSAGQATGGDAAGAPACDPNDCQNGGDCPASGAACDCPQEFTGANCELPRFEALKLPNNATAANGLGLSADGSIAVGNVTSGQQHGFRWTHAGGLVLLESLPAQTVSNVTGISADGQVVIGRSGAMNEGVYWPGGKIVAVSLLTATWESLLPLFVSADGSVIAGTGTLTAGSKPSAFRWTEADGPVSLGDFQATNVYVTGMSADGSVIIGNAGDGLPTTGFAYDINAQGNKLTQLSKLALDDRTSALGISPDGSLIVGDSIATGGGSSRVRWSSPTTPPTLLDPNDPGTDAWGCGGGPFSTCGGPSADGSVIYTQRNSVAQLWTAADGLKPLALLATKFGCVITTPPHEPLLGGIAGTCFGPPRAVIWDDQGAVSRLNDVLTAFGVTATEIAEPAISVVRAVSHNGDTVLGDNFSSVVWVARPLP